MIRKNALGLAVGLAMAYSGAASALPTYAPAGPQIDVSIATVIAGGWTECFSGLYGDGGASISGIAAGCGGAGTLMMLAGGVTGSGMLDVLAWAPIEDVMFDTGTGNTPHDANSTGWYFNDSYSWGFAPAGAAISRSSCDTVDSTSFGTGPTVHERLCWHTGGGALAGGWRVGDVDFLNSEPTGYTRYVFTSAGAVPEPGTAALLGLGLLGGLMARRRRK